MKIPASHILILIFSISICSAAETISAPPSITLEALVAQALTDNPELLFYEAEIAATKGERRSATSWSNPELSTEVGRKRVRGDINGEGSAWAVSVLQTFEWPGRVSLRKAIADRQIQFAQAGLEQFRATLAAQVRQKGFALFVAQRREAAATEVADRGEELVSTLVQREPAGVAPLLETRAIEALVITLRRQAIEASREVQTALYELNALRGKPVAEQLVVSEALTEIVELPSVDELIHRAARGNFELKQREIELTQQGFKVRLAKNERWPSITLGSQVSQENVGSEKETTAGIGVSIPLPLWNRNEGGIETANARLLQAETSLRVMQRSLEQRIRENAAIYERLRKELTWLNPKVAEQLRDAALLADRHYRLGAVPLATYLEVQKSYLEALEAIFSTRTDALNARAELDLLTGNAIPPILRGDKTTPGIAPRAKSASKTQAK